MQLLYGWMDGFIGRMAVTEAKDLDVLEFMLHAFQVLVLFPIQEVVQIIKFSAFIDVKALIMDHTCVFAGYIIFYVSVAPTFVALKVSAYEWMG